MTARDSFHWVVRLSRELAKSLLPDGAYPSCIRPADRKPDLMEDRRALVEVESQGKLAGITAGFE